MQNLLGAVFVVLALVTSLSAQSVPLPPTNLSFSVAGSAVTIQWTASVTPDVTYVLEAGSAPGLSNLANYDTGSASTTFTAVSVPPGTYYVRLRSRNAAGVSGVSTELVVTVGDIGSPCTQPPAAPTAITARVTGQLVSLSWMAGVGCPVQSYVVLVGSQPSGTDLGVFDVGATTTLSASAAPAIYYVRLQARNRYGTSGASHEVIVVVFGSADEITYALAGVFHSSTEPLLPVGTPYTATLTFAPSTLTASSDPLGGTRYSSGRFSFRTATVALSGLVSISIDSARSWIRIDHLRGLQGTFSAGLRINLNGARLTSDRFPSPFPTLADLTGAQLIINTSTSHIASITVFAPMR